MWNRDTLIRPIALRSFLVAAMAVVVSDGGSAVAAASSSAQAEQLRIVQEMSELMRARIDKLPTLVSEEVPVGEVRDLTVTLNQESVMVGSQRFDGIVITTPDTRASFAWAFVCPANVARWYILREQGEMNGFGDFVRRPRAKLSGTEDWQPQGRPDVTLQKLDSARLTPNSRYVLWFEFEDDLPTTFSVRAGFFPNASLSNGRLPGLLFPPKGK